MRALVLLFALAACGPLQTVSGGPGCVLTRLADVPLTTERFLPLVPVTVNGETLRMVLDTGAERTLILAHVATRLGLIHDPSRRSEVRGIGRPSVSYDVRPDSLMFGPLTLTAPALAVGRFHLATDGPEPDGFLGLDMLSRFDLEVDPAAGRLTFYAPRHCEAAPATGPRWTRLADGVNRFGTFLVPASLDGMPLHLSLDTGAEQSLLSLDNLDAVGLDRRELGDDPYVALAGMSPAMTAVRLHRFGVLRAGGIEAVSPSFAMAPLSPIYGDGLLGSDIVAGRRLWLSSASEKVWVAAQ